MVIPSSRFTLQKLHLLTNGFTITPSSNIVCVLIWHSLLMLQLQQHRFGYIFHILLTHFFSFLRSLRFLAFHSAISFLLITFNFFLCFALRLGIIKNQSTYLNFYGECQPRHYTHIQPDSFSTTTLLSIIPIILIISTLVNSL